METYQETNNGPSETTAEMEWKEKIEAQLQGLCQELDKIHFRFVRQPDRSHSPRERERGQEAIQTLYREIVRECERYGVVPPRLNPIGRGYFAAFDYEDYADTNGRLAFRWKEGAQ